ncbi:GH92 family glycosyl hydrolase [Pedobacter sp. SD-b]|uniref:GH92 family glycosyl hydrolase n=1 Tax=Pedobacter segetis TaxID=2793069 RepID=A0ABS1BLJ4_9SPHI|nr:GH92 family glycosyl hydrolase [Pedobacter segetis]MBK0383616.1 GH92 family glycosyl hydrolase [Pedobacter segetis]
MGKFFFKAYSFFLFFIFIFLQAVFAQQKQQKAKKPVDLVYPQLDTEHSRWFFFSSASRPFGMVNLSPDTQLNGAWDSGYRYQTDTIKGFSHVHGWQISALSVMPVTITNQNKQNVFTDFYSKFKHSNEKVSPGYHLVKLERYGITAELTSTKRVGFHRYTFPKAVTPAILFNLNTLLGPCNNVDGKMEQTGAKTLSGEITMSPTMRRPKVFKVFFQIVLNANIDSLNRDEKTGNYLVFTDKKKATVLMKAGISYTSLANAKSNINSELPKWDFNAIVEDAKKEWNGMLARIKIKGGTEIQQRRFYTDLWHALQGRRTISDANGAYPDNTGQNFRIGQLPLDKNGKPKFEQYNSDAFWGSQWTIQTLWGLVYPEVMASFSNSLLQYAKDGGFVPRGPSGGNYTYVMTGAGTTPFLVSAVQKGLITENLQEVYQTLKRNHIAGGMMEKAGYEHKTAKGGGLAYYIKKGYVPYPNPDGNFASHQDGASLTLEYAYQDWTLAQLAKKLNLTEDYNYFIKRSSNWRNVFDESIGWMRPKDVNGNWLKKYDPYQFGKGFIEANGAQNTWYVPQDMAGLAQMMGGKEKAVDKLNAQFELAQKLGFTAGTSHAEETHPEYKRIPINYGNQPSIQTAFIFNQLGRPDLTQYWSRRVVDKVFSGLSPDTGYNGDEDQGLMGSLAVLMKIGLFQMNGGTEQNPEYEFGSPIFDQVDISLQNNKHLIINADGTSAERCYIKSVQENGTDTERRYINHLEILKGATLNFKMSNQP